MLVATLMVNEMRLVLVRARICAIDQRASYVNPTVACAVLRRTATAMVAARFIQPLFDQSERALSVVLAVP